MNEWMIAFIIYLVTIKTSSIIDMKEVPIHRFRTPPLLTEKKNKVFVKIIKTIGILIVCYEEFFSQNKSVRIVVRLNNL